MAKFINADSEGASDSSPQESPRCQQEACDLQSCLRKNTYSPERCNDDVRKLYQCCQRMYEETDGKGTSTACPSANVIKHWLKKHSKTL
ncbi:hypothetical protein AX14_010858 [Amanita brunnescens Koide BX004]|nr:hypothetical protein AX14_010858 [Amanita brunnescens Koide BX004]